MGYMPAQLTHKVQDRDFSMDSSTPRLAIRLLLPSVGACHEQPFLATRLVFRWWIRPSVHPHGAVSLALASRTYGGYRPGALARIPVPSRRLVYFGDFVLFLTSFLRFVGVRDSVLRPICFFPSCGLSSQFSIFSPGRVPAGIQLVGRSTGVARGGFSCSCGPQVSLLWHVFENPSVVPVFTAPHFPASRTHTPRTPFSFARGDPFFFFSLFGSAPF